MMFEHFFLLTKTIKEDILNRLCTTIQYKKQQLILSCRSKEIDTKLGHKEDLNKLKRVLVFRIITNKG